METINYYDGQAVIQVEVNNLVAEAYRQIRRDEWRISKRDARQHSRISLDQLDEDNECLADPFASDHLEVIIEKEKKEESNAKMQDIIKTLTERQEVVLNLLKKGKAVTEIAEILNVTKQSVGDIRKALQKKFEVFLK